MTETAAQCPAAALASTKARCGTWSLRAMKHVRLAAQLLALALLLAPLWWPLIFQAPSIYQGNIAASRLQLGPASIPMSDPFTTLCVLAGSRTVPVTLLAGAGLVLGFYLLVRGRTFCAYACPIHLGLELWDKLLVAFRIRREPIGEAGSRWLNVALAGLVLAASALAGLPAFEPVNPINTLIRSLQPRLRGAVARGRSDGAGSRTGPPRFLSASLPGRRLLQRDQPRRCGRRGGRSRVVHRLPSVHGELPGGAGTDRGHRAGPPDPPEDPGGFSALHRLLRMRRRLRTPGHRILEPVAAEPADSQ